LLEQQLVAEAGDGGGAVFGQGKRFNVGEDQGPQSGGSSQQVTPASSGDDRFGDAVGISS
jgi:hypothetical protein